jgi:hypothetical protein
MGGIRWREKVANFSPILQISTFFGAHSPRRENCRFKKDLLKRVFFTEVVIFFVFFSVFLPQL